MLVQHWQFEVDTLSLAMAETMMTVSERSVVVAVKEYCSMGSGKEAELSD